MLRACWMLSGTEFWSILLHQSRYLVISFRILSLARSRSRIRSSRKILISQLSASSGLCTLWHFVFSSQASQQFCFEQPFLVVSGMLMPKISHHSSFLLWSVGSLKIGCSLLPQTTQDLWDVSLGLEAMNNLES